MAFRIAVLCVSVALLLPAAAAAQTAPDERAAARAFTDAALQLTAAIEPLQQQVESLFEERPPRCIRRHQDRLSERRYGELALLQFVHSFRQIGQLFEPPLNRFSMQLHGIQTADPALRSGRTAWRRVRRFFAELAAMPAIDVCAEARRYVRGGFEPTPTMKRAVRLAFTFSSFGEGELDRRLTRARLRLQQLGIPRREAAAFTGDLPG